MESPMLRGGRLVGQGSTGCVFAPPLATVASLCKPSKAAQAIKTKAKANAKANAKAKEAGKVLLLKYADAELDAAAAVRALDPTQAFSVYPSEGYERVMSGQDFQDVAASAGGAAQLGACEAKHSFPQTLEAALRRPVKHGSRDAAVQLRIPQAQDMRRFAAAQGQGLRAYAKALKAFQNLFEGMALLHGVGQSARPQLPHDPIAHMDIKEDNIVAQDGVLKFVDFGLAAVRNANLVKDMEARDTRELSQYPTLLTLHCEHGGRVTRENAAAVRERIAEHNATVAAERAVPKYAWLPGIEHTLETLEADAATLRRVFKVRDASSSHERLWAAARATDLYGMSAIVAFLYWSTCKRVLGAFPFWLGGLESAADVAVARAALDSSAVHFKTCALVGDLLRFKLDETRAKARVDELVDAVERELAGSRDTKKAGHEVHRAKAKAKAKAKEAAPPKKRTHTVQKVLLPALAPATPTPAPVQASTVVSRLLKRRRTSQQGGDAPLAERPSPTLPLPGTSSVRPLKRTRGCARGQGTE